GLDCCVDLHRRIRPRGVAGATATDVRPGWFADVGETTIPAGKPSLVLQRIADHQMHELDTGLIARRRTAPGLPSLLAVIDRIDDDRLTESQVQVRHRADGLVRGDTDLPTSRQATGEDR